MTAECRPEGAVLPAEMPLLLFHAAGVALGVEAVAVEGILDAEQARQAGVACRDLAELFGAGGRTGPAPDKQLLLRGARRGIGIDSLDEIVTIPTTALQPLPALLSYDRRPGAFWGGIVRENKVVLLLDAERFLEPATATDEPLF